MVRRHCIVGLLLICACLASSRAGQGCGSGTGSLALEPGPFCAVYLIPMRDAERVSVHIFIQSGGGDSGHEQGLAHYVEHLAWLSAVGRRPRSIDWQSNAWTGHWSTEYRVSGPAEDLQGLLARLAGIFDPIALDPSFAEQEREIVLREFDLHFGGSYRNRMEKMLSRDLYGETGLGRYLLGRRERIPAFSVRDALALHAETHLVHLAVLVITGNVAPSEVRAAISASFADAPRVAEPRVQPPSFHMLPDARIVTTHREKRAGGPSLVYRKIVALEGQVPFDHLETHLAFLRDVLDTNLEGGLARALRFDAFVAASYDLEMWPVDERHVEMRFAARPDRDVSVERLLAAFEAALLETAEGGIPRATYDRVAARFARGWPDWEDEHDVAEYMQYHVLARVAERRRPLAIDAVRALQGVLSLETTNALLHAITGPGRVRAAMIVPEERRP